MRFPSSLLFAVLCACSGPPSSGTSGTDRNVIDRPLDTDDDRGAAPGTSTPGTTSGTTGSSTGTTTTGGTTVPLVDRCAGAPDCVDVALLTPQWTLEAGWTSGVIKIPGDMNGDGLDDALVDLLDPSGATMAAIVHGPLVRSAVLPADADTLITGQVSKAIDLNADGLVDLFLPVDDGDPLDGMDWMVPVLAPFGAALDPATVVEPWVESGWISDLDGDGAADRTILNPGSTVAEVWFGDWSTWESRTADLIVNDGGCSGHDGHGLSILNLPDVDGDGVAELYTPGEWPYIAHPHCDRAMFPANTRGEIDITTAPGVVYGVNLNARGDLDHDGREDFLYDGYYLSGPITYVDGLPDTTDVAVVPHESVPADFSFDIMPLDLDGDGFEDVRTLADYAASEYRLFTTGPAGGLVTGSWRTVFGPNGGPSADLMEGSLPYWVFATSTTFTFVPLR